MSGVLRYFDRRDINETIVYEVRTMKLSAIFFLALSLIAASFSATAAEDNGRHASLSSTNLKSLTFRDTINEKAAPTIPYASC